MQFYHFSYSHPSLKPLRKGRKTTFTLRNTLAPSTNVCTCKPLFRLPLDSSQVSGHHLTVHQPEWALPSSRVLGGLTMACSHPTARVLSALQEPTNTFMPNPEPHGRKKRATPRTQLNLSLPLFFFHRQDASDWPTAELELCARQQRTLLH